MSRYVRELLETSNIYAFEDGLYFESLKRPGMVIHAFNNQCGFPEIKTMYNTSLKSYEMLEKQELDEVTSYFKPILVVLFVFLGVMLYIDTKNVYVIYGFIFFFVCGVLNDLSAFLDWLAKLYYLKGKKETRCYYKAFAQTVAFLFHHEDEELKEQSVCNESPYLIDGYVINESVYIFSTLARTLFDTIILLVMLYILKNIYDKDVLVLVIQLAFLVISGAFIFYGGKSVIVYLLEKSKYQNWFIKLANLSSISKPNYLHYGVAKALYQYYVGIEKSISRLEIEHMEYDPEKDMIKIVFSDGRSGFINLF